MSRHGGARQGSVAVDTAEENTNKRSLTKRLSERSLSGVSGRSVCGGSDARLSRVSFLRESFNVQHDNLARILLTSKETADRRCQVESAFRFCKEAFLEVATTLTNLLEERSADSTEVIRNAIRNALEDIKVHKATMAQDITSAPTTYASVAARDVSKVHASHGSSFEVPKTASFMIMPDGENADKYASSRDTRETVCRILRPADCDLKVRRVMNARNNGIKIEAVSPNIEKIKANLHLAKAGLKVVEKTKLNPRLMIYSIPSEMSPEEIKKELIAQNLNNDKDVELQIIYIYKPKPNKTVTSCVIEVSPEVRKRLLANGRIYLRFSACTFTDHVRVLQCYRCMTFGHIARDCKSAPVCGHCSEQHEMKDCKNKAQPPLCCNCSRTSKRSTNDLVHSASDVEKCPILSNKVRDKITNINYE